MVNWKNSLKNGFAFINNPIRHMAAATAAIFYAIFSMCCTKNANNG